ncbi:hypothetical protein KX726_00525 [Xanthomonas oryzae pv. oryzae]|nr:hypothetical protein KX727_00530 [Xanthomonas oryzae pv. oryzae]UQA43743.1 hypothetical protein KX725_00525 [Xanthomonas oryzae pv. oryzae]UQA47369.1 hypothetical protein KX726_00525 [Xanthomonas oryzae pv. oryzae]
MNDSGAANGECAEPQLAGRRQQIRITTSPARGIEYSVDHWLEQQGIE